MGCIKLDKLERATSKRSSQIRMGSNCKPITKKCVSTYTFGFNGMEMDNEVKGTGNHFTTFFRQYDPRLGRWFSRDPKASVQPWESPFISMGNNPINFNDPLGDYKTKKAANRAHDKAAKKYKDDESVHIGDVRFEKDKNEFYFSIDANTGITDADGVFLTNTINRNIYGKSDYSTFKGDVGLCTPYYLSFNISFVVGGGFSLTFGYAQDKFRGRTGFFTLGGGIGFEAGVGVNAGGIKDENGNEFRVGHLDGPGYQISGGIGPFSVQKAGNDESQDFNHKKDKTYTMIEGGGAVSQGIPILKLTKISKGTNFQVGASHQWTETWTFGGNKQSKK